jgi:hypothetical protein
MPDPDTLDLPIEERPKRSYRIVDGIWGDAIYFELEGDPPCLYCGEPVTSPSMDGPLVCGPCDIGRNRDGTRWTEAQAKERHAHFQAELARHRANATKIVHGVGGRR